MAKYIMLLDYTQQGIAKIKESPNRAEAARSLVRECGAELKELYLTMGEHDLVAIVEAPDDETTAKAALAIGALGNVRSKTLRAFTEDEFRGIVQSLP